MIKDVSSIPWSTLDSAASLTQATWREEAGKPAIKKPVQTHLYTTLQLIISDTSVFEQFLQ